MVASEAAPFAKTGGLADVAGALPLALGRLGHRVTLVVPRYGGVEEGTPIDRFGVELGSRTLEAGLFEHTLGPGARALLVECPELYDREALYGVGSHDYPDNARRFAFLARVALDLAIRAGERPSVVHAHDWQGGLLPVYLKTRYANDRVIGGVPCVFTIHNIAYQGLFPPAWLPDLDLGWELFIAEALEYWGNVSFLKGGILFSEMITTVSRRYAEEIQRTELGFGFQGIVARRAADLTGITNGIDVEVWDPSRDPFLPAHYDATNLGGKTVAKRGLLQTFGLPHDEAALEQPLVGMISRMIDQKGFDLLAELAPMLSHVGARFVLLGQGERHYEDLWKELALGFPDRIGAKIGFDEELAHQIEAGADIFLMPSRFEPCGLNQMYSLRYGTIPVVHATGGLDDTITDYTGRRRARSAAPDEAQRARSGKGKATGFKFYEYTPAALIGALQRALEAYAKPAVWKGLQREAMRQDHSWDASAREYVKTYERAIAAAPRPAAAVG